jgi:YesN/AraC family two-component response regulator
MYGINRTYLSRIFKECQGINLSEALKRLKLMRCAFFMLEKNNLTVKETCDLFGFDCLNYFIKAFKNVFGITPGKFIRCK